MAFLLRPLYLGSFMAASAGFAVYLVASSGSWKSWAIAAAVALLLWVIGFPLMLVGMIVSFHRRGQYHSALRFLALFERIQWSATIARDFKAHMLASIGELEEAERLMRNAVQDPNRNPLFRAIDLDSLGEVLVMRHKWDEAEQVLRQAIAADEHRGGSYVSLAEVLLRRDGDAAQSLVMLAAALQAEAANPHAEARKKLGDDLACEVESIRAIALCDLGRHAEAEKALNAALSRQSTSRPEAATMHYCAGEVYEKLGRKREALERYRAAATSDPEGLTGANARAAADRLAVG